MAAIDHTSAPRSASLLSRIGASLRHALDSYVEARSRSAEFNFYNNMSDSELAAHGLRREDIARHVFRDLYL